MHRPDTIDLDLQGVGWARICALNAPAACASSSSLASRSRAVRPIKPSHPGASKAATVPPTIRALLPESKQQNRRRLVRPSGGLPGVTGLAAWE
jgi:hypothetical protein